MRGCSRVLSCLVLSSLLFGGVRGYAGEGALPAAGLGGVERIELPPLPQVERRLGVYTEKLAQWRNLGERTSSPALSVQRPAEWAGCSAAVENLAHGYGHLKEEIIRRNEPAGQSLVALTAPWQVFFEDIAFLEGGCGQVERQVADLVAVDLQAIAQGRSDGGEKSALLGEQEQLDKWNKGVSLFDSGNYDEAISELTCLMNTPHMAEAKEKIRDAQTIVATQLRRQAAGVLAVKTDDPAQKKKMLSEAWLMLNKIISSYPEAAIIDKVKQNQMQIEGQLVQLDPAMLLRLKGGAAN